MNGMGPRVDGTLSKLETGCLGGPRESGSR